MCDDGLTGSARLMLDHPEGFDPPDHEKVVYKHIKDCKKFTQVEAKAGDTFIVHGMLVNTFVLSSTKRLTLVICWLSLTHTARIIFTMRESSRIRKSIWWNRST